MLKQKKYDLSSQKFYKAIQKKEKLEQKFEKENDFVNGKPIINMMKLFKFIKKINTIFKPFSPCKKNCSKCCNIDVAVSGMELDLIEKYLATKKNKTIVRKTENVVNIFIKEVGEERFGKMCKGEKCPFLKKDKCSIYKVRPYFCREYMVFEKDNRKCGYNDEWVNQLGPLMKNGFYYRKILQNTYKINEIFLNQALYEIRDCFYKVN